MAVRYNGVNYTTFTADAATIASTEEWTEAVRVTAAGRRARIELAVQADTENVDTITDIKITDTSRAGGTHYPLMSGSDLATPDRDAPSIRIMDADGAYIGNWPTTAVPENGTVIIELTNLAYEYAVHLKGGCTVDISGSVGR
jgi:hypothetical protein